MATRRWRPALILTALLPGIFLGSWALAQEGAEPGGLSRTLGTAALSPEGQALLRQKAAEVTRAGIPESEVAAIIARGADRGVQPAAIARLLDGVAEAGRRELPVGPVLDKVKEGLAKGVPPERIVAVASQLAGDLARSRDLIHRVEREGVRVEGRGERERAIEAVADAIGRGVSQQQLEELSRRVAGSSRREATMSRLEAGAQATADLVSMGLSPREASETLGVALSRGLPRRDLERLRESLARERRQGGSLEDGARRIREEILSGRGEHRRGRDQERDRGRDRDRGDHGGREDRGGDSSGRH